MDQKFCGHHHRACDEPDPVAVLAQMYGHGFPSAVMLSGVSVAAFHADWSGAGKFGTDDGEAVIRLCARARARISFRPSRLHAFDRATGARLAGGGE